MEKPRGKRKYKKGVFRRLSLSIFYEFIIDLIFFDFSLDILLPLFLIIGVPIICFLNTQAIGINLALILGLISMVIGFAWLKFNISIRIKELEDEG